MSVVEFDEQNNFGPGGSSSSELYTPEPEATGFAAFLIKKGIASNASVANAILVAISLCSLGLTIFVIVKFIL